MEEIPWQLVRLVGPIVILAPPITYYVYRDKKKRGENHALVTGLGYGLLGLIGLFTYLYRRGDFTPSTENEEPQSER